MIRKIAFWVPLAIMDICRTCLQKGWIYECMWTSFYHKMDLHSLLPNFVEWFLVNIFVTSCRSHMGVSALDSESKLWHFNFFTPNDLFGDLDFSFRPSPWNVRLSGPLGLYISHNWDNNLKSLHIPDLDILHWVQWTCSRWVLSRCDKEKLILP